MPANGKYSAAELQGTPTPNGFGETEPLAPPSGYVPGFVPPNPASLMQDLSNHSGDTCALMPQMPAATFCGAHRSVRTDAGNRIFHWRRLELL